MQDQAFCPLFWRKTENIKKARKGRKKARHKVEFDNIVHNAEGKKTTEQK